MPTIFGGHRNTWNNPHVPPVGEIRPYGTPFSPYLMHGVQELGELVEPLPVLAGVLLALDDGLAQLLDVRHADLVEHHLALQAVLWHCRGERGGGGEVEMKIACFVFTIHVEPLHDTVKKKNTKKTNKPMTQNWINLLGCCNRWGIMGFLWHWGNWR